MAFFLVTYARNGEDVGLLGSIVPDGLISPTA